MPKSLSKILNKLKSCLIGVVIFLVVMPVVSILFSAMSYLSYGVFKLLHPNTETSYTTPGYFFALSWILTLMAAMFVIWFIILLRALRPLLKKTHQICRNENLGGQARTDHKCILWRFSPLAVSLVPHPCNAHFSKKPHTSRSIRAAQRIPNVGHYRGRIRVFQRHTIKLSIRSHPF